MGSFNWTGAMSGLLGEGGRQAGIYADKLGRLDEIKLKAEYDERRERAKLVRDKALKDYQYDIDSRAAETKHGYAMEIEGLKPEKDNRTSLQQNVEAFGEDKYMTLMGRNGGSGSSERGVEEPTEKDFERLRALTERFPDTEGTGGFYGLFAKGSDGLTQRERIKRDGGDVDITEYDYLMNKINPGQEVSAGDDSGILERSGLPNGKADGEKKPSAARDALDAIKKGNEKEARNTKIKEKAMSSVDPGDIIKIAEKAMGGTAKVVGDSAKLMAKVNKLAAEGLLDANTVASESIVDFISWVKNVMTADTDQVEALKGTATGRK